MEQQITCPSCGTLAATLTVNTATRITPQWRKPTLDLTDQIEMFVRLNCGLGSDSTVSVRALRKAYETWATDQSLEPISAKRFSMEINKLPGVARTRRSDERFFTGVRLLP